MMNAKEHKINIQLNPDNIDSPASEKYRTILTNNLNRVFGEYLKKRDKYACQLSGAMRNVDVYPYFIDVPCLKYNEDNYHMMLKRVGDAHVEHKSMQYNKYMVEKYGWDKLNAMCGGVNKVLKISEILKLTEIYTSKIKALGDVTRWEKPQSQS